MSLQRFISLLAAGLTISLIASLLVSQPVFAKGKKAYFTGYFSTSNHRWVADHCEINPSVGVKVKGKGSFTLYLRADTGAELTLVHQQLIHGPMDFWVRLHDIAVGRNGESVALEWTLEDKRERVKSFFVLGPFDCSGPA